MEMVIKTIVINQINEKEQENINAIRGNGYKTKTTIPKTRETRMAR